MKQITRVTLEAMKLEDISRVVEIERESFNTPWPRDAYTHELTENRLAAYLVARTDGDIVGYAGMGVILGQAHITTIAVDPAFRGQHIGERVLVGLIDAALGRRARCVTPAVGKAHATAQAL